jgi:hypothetical protein
MFRSTRSSITWWRMSAAISADVVGLHDFQPLAEDRLALVVHHVVELQQLLADVEVAAFDLGLRRSSDLLTQG